MEAWVVALIAGAFFGGGLVKGALGLGLPVVVLTVLAPTIGLKTAIALVVLPSIASNAWQALAGPSFVALVRRLWSFLGAAAIGIFAGVNILAGSETGALDAMLGAMLATYSVISLLTPQLPPPGPRERWMSPVAGATAGALFGMTGIFIVPGILYLQTLGLGRHVFVQALGITFLTISVTLGICLSGYDLISGEEALLSAGAILPAFAGLTLGRRVRHRISEELFRRVFFISLILAGLYMIGRAVA